MALFLHDVPKKASVNLEEAYLHNTNISRVHNYKTRLYTVWFPINFTTFIRDTHKRR